jgi:hypothetical protein
VCTLKGTEGDDQGEGTAACLCVAQGARRRRREGRRSDVNVKEHDDGDVQDARRRGSSSRRRTGGSCTAVLSRRDRRAVASGLWHHSRRIALAESSAKTMMDYSKKNDFSLLSV